MKLIQPEVAKVLQALGANLGDGRNVATTEQKQREADLQAARLKAMEDAGATKEELSAYMKNANELMHTGNTGFGEELIPTAVLTEEVIKMVPEYATFLGSLPGFHGTNMPISQIVSVRGEVGLFRGNTEQTTGAQAIRQPKNRLSTGKVQINQGQFIADIFLTKRELNYAIGDIEAFIKEELSKSAARTIEALILNADSANAGATGNMNLDDDTPVADEYYMQQADGLRRLALATAVNAGTLDIGDFISMMNLLGDLYQGGNPCVWITNTPTYNKALGLADFADAAKRGEKSTIAGNAITNVFGADLFVARDNPLTEADGKVSATPGNNVKGLMNLLYKPSVQYGYGQPIDIEVTKVAGKGVQVTGTFEFGFAIAQKLAGMTDSSVASAINITL